MGGAGRVAEGRTEGTGRPQGGEAKAVEELQWAWADLRRRQERVEGAEREGGQREKGGGQDSRPPLMTFRQPAVPPEQESEMQESAWRPIRGEAARLTERDREVAARERRVREEEEAVALGGTPGPPGSGRGHPLHGCRGAVNVREKGQGGGRGGGAGEGQAAPGGGAGSRGSGGGAAASQPQPRADASGLGLGVATPAAVLLPPVRRGPGQPRLGQRGTWRSWSAT